MMGGWAPTPSVSFLCKAIKSLEGHAVPTIWDSNM